MILVDDSFVFSGHKDHTSWVEYDAEAHTISLCSAHTLNADEFAELQQLIVVAQYMAGMLEEPIIYFNNLEIGTRFKFLSGTTPYIKIAQHCYTRVDNGRTIRSNQNFPVMVIESIKPEPVDFKDIATGTHFRFLDGKLEYVKVANLGFAPVDDYVCGHIAARWNSLVIPI